jgi:hypothetical protein
MRCGMQRGCYPIDRIRIFSTSQWFLALAQASGLAQDGSAGKLGSAPASRLTPWIMVAPARVNPADVAGQYAGPTQ